MTVILHRRTDLTREAFTAHWLDLHAPLVRSLAGALGIQHYVQMHLETSPDMPFDGLAHVSLVSRDDMLARLHTSPGRDAARTIRADERVFLDVDRSVTLWGRTSEIL